LLGFLFFGRLDRKDRVGWKGREGRGEERETTRTDLSKSSEPHGYPSSDKQPPDSSSQRSQSRSCIYKMSKRKTKPKRVRFSVPLSFLPSSPSLKVQLRFAADSDSRLSLLGIKRIDIAPHEHVRKHEVLEDLNSLRRSGLVELLEGFEEVGGGLGPVLCWLSGSE